MLVRIKGSTAKLYGRIWAGDAPYIIDAIQPLLDMPECTIHLHTPGGSVIDGNLMYNAIATSKATVTTVNDGLCASMGSVILLAGNKVKMASNALWMAHAPQGDARGTKEALRQTADVLESMEEHLLEAYAARTGKPEKELKKLMKGDNWYNAKQALADGFIDEIITPVIKKIDGVTAEGKIDMKLVADAFAAFEAKGEFPHETIKTDTMKLNATNLVALGFSADAAPTEAEVNSAVEKQATQIATLKATNETLTGEKEAREAAQVKSLLDKGQAEGRFTPADREQFEALAKSNFALAESTIQKLPIKKDLNGRSIPSNTTGSITEERKDWDFNAWCKNDPAGLNKLKAEDSEAYNAIKR